MGRTFNITFDPVPPKIDGSRKHVIVVFKKPRVNPHDAVTYYRSKFPNDKSVFLDVVEMDAEDTLVE